MFQQQAQAPPHTPLFGRSPGVGEMFNSMGTPQANVQQQQFQSQERGFGGGGGAYQTPVRRMDMFQRNTQEETPKDRQHQSEAEAPTFFGRTKRPSGSGPGVNFSAGFDFSSQREAEGFSSSMEQPASHNLHQQDRFGPLESHTSSSTPVSDRLSTSAHSKSQALAPLRSTDDDMEYDLLPPKTSLLSGLPSRSTSFFSSQEEDSLRDRMDTTGSDGVRRRQAIRTPSSSVGLDVGPPRGLDFIAQKTPQREVEELGVTAAIQMIQVKSPWVTVFGYPSGTGFAVLRHFQSFGEVHQHHSDSGNWMHILYGSKVAASRALAQNGQLILVDGSEVMVGVKPCSDPALANATATAAIPSSEMDQKLTDYYVRQPEKLKKAPKRSVSVCKRFWTWVLDP